MDSKEFDSWNYDLSGVSNRVDYGKPAEVIAFMREALNSGDLAEFKPLRWRLENVEGKAKITRLSS